MYLVFLRPLLASLTLSALIFSGCQTRQQNGTKVYHGHGQGSVSDKVIRRHEAPELLPSLRARVEATMDIRSTGLGIPSADARALYFNWNVSGISQIWKSDRDSKFPIQLTGGENATSIEGVAPNDQYLVVSRDQKGDEYSGLYTLSSHGGKLHTIVAQSKVQARLNFISDDSRFIYYTANIKDPKSFSILRYDVKSKETLSLFEEPGTWWIDDQRDNGKTLLLVKAPGNIAREYYEYRLLQEQPLRYKLIPLFGQNEEESYSARYGHRSGQIIVKTSRFGNYAKLYEWRDQKFKAITPDINHDIGRFIVDRQRKKIGYELNENGYVKLNFLDARSFKPLYFPDFKKAGLVHFGNFDSTGRYMTFSVEGSNQPQQVYLYDWRRGSYDEWTKPSTPEANTSQFIKASLETYSTRDGVNVPMFVFRSSRCQEPCPVIAYFHGGPESQWQPWFSASDQLLLEEGFHIVKPNVRGSMGYGKEWLHSDNASKRLQVISDIADVAIHIKTKWVHNGVAPMVGALGGSYGGYSTLMALTKYAKHYDAGVSVVGMSSLLTFLNNTAPYRRHLRTSEYGDPDKDKEALLQLSPTTYLAEVDDPVMIIQGVNDPRVPAGEAVQIYESMKDKGLAAELILFADEGHGVRQRSNRVLYFGNMIRFFNKHLKKASPPEVQQALNK